MRNFSGSPHSTVLDFCRSPRRRPAMASLRERIASLFRPEVHAIGLGVGTSALKGVELRGGNPPSPASLALRPLPPGLIQDALFVDEAGLAAEIRSLLNDAGISQRSVVTAVSNRQAITRNIMLPRMSLQRSEEHTSELQSRGHL